MRDALQIFEKSNGTILFSIKKRVFSRKMEKIKKLNLHNPENFATA